jgi:NAD(P)H dehydrogenase (quinone)
LVRLAARTPGKVADLGARGFEVVHADYDDEASLARAFVGARTALVISGDGTNEVRIRQHKAVIDAALTAGVQHIAYTSVINPTPQTRFTLAATHVETEAYLKASGVAYTFLRDNMYAANLDTLLAAASSSGVLAVPGAAGKVSYVLHADVAAAAAAVLTGEGHENAAYDVTGSEALDAYDVAGTLSEALGRDVATVEAAPEDFAAHLRGMGLPPFYVEALLSIYAATAAGEYARVSDDVARLTGRPAGSVREHVRAFARQHAAALTA